MFLLNGKKLSNDTPFSIGEGENAIQYPANWIRLSTPEERAEIGITEISDPIRPDDRFYFVSENGDGTITAVPKSIDSIKSMLVTQAKEISGNLLSITDWKIVRAAEGVKPVDQDTLNYRSAVRAASNGFEAQINACTTIEELSALQFIWPLLPIA